MQLLNSDQTSAFGFPDFLEDNWQTNGCVPYSELTVLCCSKKKTDDHLLGSVACASNFCWIWLILKHPYSQRLFTFGLIRVNPRFIICHGIIDVFWSTAIVFVKHFFQPIDKSFFWAIDKLWRVQCEQIFFTVKFLCNIECILVLTMPKIVSVSQ